MIEWYISTVALTAQVVCKKNWSVRCQELSFLFEILLSYLHGGLNFLQERKQLNTSKQIGRLDFKVIPRILADVFINWCVFSRAITRQAKLYQNNKSDISSRQVTLQPYFNTRYLRLSSNSLIFYHNETTMLIKNLSPNCMYNWSLNVSHLSCHFQIPMPHGMIWYPWPRQCWRQSFT